MQVSRIWWIFKVKNLPVAFLPPHEESLPKISPTQRKMEIKRQKSDDIVWSSEFNHAWSLYHLLLFNFCDPINFLFLLNLNWIFASWNYSPDSYTLCLLYMWESLIFYGILTLSNLLLKQVYGSWIHSLHKAERIIIFYLIKINLVFVGLMIRINFQKFT